MSGWHARGLVLTIGALIVSAAVRFGPILPAALRDAGAEVLRAGPGSQRPAGDRPNIVVILADDMGYGDLGAYGHPTIRTPHLDRLAAEGQRWTQFYAAASVCTPSRAGLLTGRLPIRFGMSGQRRVLFPDSALGLPPEEITLAEALKARGYATGMVGKWHLGHLPAFLPTAHGFDAYFGLPYSNDMDRDAARSPAGRAAFANPRSEYWNVPLMRGHAIIERPADQTTLTRRYTEEAVGYIRANRERPFFLYVAHSMPHVPLFRSAAFADRSAAGMYGDVIEEIDWSVGRIVEALRAEGVAEQTVVFFTSDNGPWLSYETHGGSAGLLRAGKGTTWEGGMRVPMIAWWPGRIRADVVMALGASMDLFATSVALAGGAPPDRPLDGYDVRPVLFGTGDTAREAVFFYRQRDLYAVREGPWKAHFISEGSYSQFGPRIVHDAPELYQLDHDPSERFNVAAGHPDVVERLRRLAADHKAGVAPYPSRLEARIGGSATR
jgi:arylsulfatase A-like enzyme